MLETEAEKSLHF